MSDQGIIEAIVEKQFNKFNKKIQLTSKQKKDAKKRYSTVCKTLHRHYYESTYDGSTKLLFGSYGKKTNIRPPRDVDVLFILPPYEFSRYDKYESNGQSQLLQDLRNVLSKRFPTKEFISAWGKVILVEAPEGKHNIEILPAFKEEDDSFKIPNSEGGGSWESFDPRPSVDAIILQNALTKGLTRKLIRSIKRWAANTISLNIKSYEIDNHVHKFLDESESEGIQFAELLISFFEYLEKQENNADRRSYIYTARKRSEKALEYAQKDKLEDAFEEWQKIFGKKFPKSIDKSFIKEDYSEQIKELYSKYPSLNEEYLLEKYNFSTEINTEYRFRIDASVNQSGYRVDFLTMFLLKGWKLNKEKQLTFKVIENTVPKPYELYWKVRNFGQEAKDTNDLRGEISRDKGKHKIIENTKYHGEHYVECYCIKDDVCVAVDRIFVPIK
jgi:ribosomal protein S20